jgi:hypothetical protein
MQYAQNYNNSLILFNSIYVSIRNVSFYEEHAEFFDDMINLIAATICRVGNMIENDLLVLNNIIKVKNVQKELLFKIIRNMINKLDKFSQTCPEYNMLYRNILLYIESS